MAVSATFLADFSSFGAAVEKATTQLRSFDADTKNVEKSLNKMGDAFSGQKVLQQATLAVKAVNDLGGTSKLTSAEQQRLNSTVTEALAKYKALGIEAPAAMLKIQKETTTQTSLFSKMTSALGPFGPALAGAFSVGAIVGFGKELLGMGDELVRVHDRTGLSIKEVQQFSYVAEQSGNSVDELTGAIGHLQKGLTTGDQSAVGAVRSLHLNLEALQSATPAQQMSMIAAAIGKVQDPAERATLAMELFGKSGAAILPTLTSDFAKLAAEAPVMSEATARALDDAGDAMHRLSTGIKVLGADWVGLVLKAGPPLERFAFWMSGLHAPTAAFNVDAAMMGGKVDVLVDGAKALSDRLASLRSEAMEPLTAAQKAAIVELESYGVGQKEIADLVVTSELAVRKYEAAHKDADSAQKKTDESQKKWNDSITEGNNRVGALFARLQVTTPEVHNMAGEIEHLLPDFEDFAGEAKRVTDAMNQGTPAIHQNADEIRALEKELHPAALVNWGKSFQSALADIGPSVVSALEGGGDVLKSVGSAFGSSLTKNIFGSEAMKKEIGDNFGKTLGGAFNAILPGIGALAGPLISGIGKLFGGIFGKSAAEKADDDATAQIKKLDDQLLTTYGSLDRVRGMSGQLGDALYAATQEKGVAGLRDMQAALVNFNNEQKITNDAIAKFGLTWADLDSTKITAGMSDALGMLARQAGDLQTAGYDMNKVLEKQAGAYSEIAQQALKTGQVIPDAFVPIMQQLSDMGLLLDADGHKFALVGDTIVDTMEPSKKTIQDADAAVKKMIASFSGEEVFKQAFIMEQALTAVGGATHLTADEMKTVHDAVQAAIDKYKALGQEAPLDLLAIANATATAGAGMEKLIADWKVISGFNGGGGGEGNSDDRNQSHILDGFDPNVAKEVWKDQIASKGSTDQDWDRVKGQYGFKEGTRGKYLDFKAGTPTVLHGKERVSTQAEGQAEDAAWGEMVDRLESIERLLTAQPRAIRQAILAAG
jgi:hypothetical protein